MIKLIDYILFENHGSKEIFISKDMIHTMQRNNDGMTNILMKGGGCHAVKETPEEIINTKSKTYKMKILKCVPKWNVKNRRLFTRQNTE